MGRRTGSGGRKLVAGAAGLLGMSRLDAALAEGAIVIVVTASGRPLVGHNARSRSDLARVLHQIADDFAQKAVTEGE